MKTQVYWEDVSVGDEVPPLVKKPTTRQLVRWAGASGDFYELHYDKDFAQSTGLPGIIVHGAIKSAWLGQMLGDWVGEGGSIRKYGCSYRGRDVPYDTLTCKGKVVKKYLDGENGCLECEIWLENSRGQITTPGTAAVVLPRRAGNHA